MITLKELISTLGVNYSEEDCETIEGFLGKLIQNPETEYYVVIKSIENLDAEDEEYFLYKKDEVTEIFGQILNATIGMSFRVNLPFEITVKCVWQEKTTTLIICEARSWFLRGWFPRAERSIPKEKSEDLNESINLETKETKEMKEGWENWHESKEIPPNIYPHTEKNPGKDGERRRDRLSDRR